jgi:hypothetical protein
MRSSLPGAIVHGGSRVGAGDHDHVEGADSTPRLPAGSAGVAVTPVRGQRRPWLIALGALLASLGALTVVWLVGAAGQRQEVLAVRNDVVYGQALTSQDLTLARVSVDPGVAVVPWTQREAVVGQVAATRLVPGMLLTQGMIEPVGEPGLGRVMVPLPLPAQRMPAGGLRPGDQILAVSSEDGSASSPIPATVVRVGATDIDGIAVVDVTTLPAAGPELAAASANGRVALVVEPRGR